MSAGRPGRLRRAGATAGVLAAAVALLASSAPRPRGGAEPCSAPPAGAARTGDIVRTVDVDGVAREYLLHVPATYAPPRRSAVVLNFHGGGGDARLQMRRTRMNRVADEAGFLVVYPEGTRAARGRGRTWNAGGCCGNAERQGADDVRYAAALLDDVERSFCVDSGRVYASGMSNGGMMAYRLGCELAGRIAAIAPVSGALVTSDCRPTAPVSVLIFHGTADRIVPYAGGRALGTPVPSVATALRFWLERDRCPATPAANERHGSVTCERHEGCAGGTTVELCVVEGGGHTWPGSEPLLLRRATQDVDASRFIWSFFERTPPR
jgi:polyhydroxybutyrate depolymerase